MNDEMYNEVLLRCWRALEQEAGDDWSSVVQRCDLVVRQLPSDPTPVQVNFLAQAVGDIVSYYPSGDELQNIIILAAIDERRKPNPPNQTRNRVKRVKEVIEESEREVETGPGQEEKHSEKSYETSAAAEGAAAATDVEEQAEAEAEG